MLGWLVEQKRIEPHVPVWDKSERSDGTLSRAEFKFHPEQNRYECPGGKYLTSSGRSGFFNTIGRYRTNVCLRPKRTFGGYAVAAYRTQRCRTHRIACPSAVPMTFPEGSIPFASDVAKPGGRKLCRSTTLSAVPVQRSA